MQRLFVVLLASLFWLPSSSAFAQKQWLFVASPAEPPVIYAVSLDLKTGEFGELQVAAENVRTGFMSLHPNLPILYAGSVEPVEQGKPNGHVRAYTIDSQAGKLNLLNIAPTQGPVPTHIETSPDGRYVSVCHYGGDTTCIIPLQKDGSLKQAISSIQHTGSSIHPQRQKKPHPHGVAISADSRFVLCADLGNDHVEVFRVTDDLKLEQASFWKAQGGAGPRHVSFHPNKKWVYSINELDSTLSVLSFDAATGKLTELETLSTLPEGYDSPSYTAEVVVHPSGKFVYGSNRGHNSTAVFEIAAETGKLKLIELEPTQGDHPRFVGLDPSGQIFIAANRNANNLVSFKIDQETGELTPTGKTLNVAGPMCVLFVNAGSGQTE